MAKWKELGEVPDSDDESGFDSSQEESQHEDLPRQLIDDDIEDAVTTEESTIQNKTIWDIPLSSQTSGREPDINQSSAQQPLPLLSDAPVTPETVQPPPDSSPLSSPILDPIDLPTDIPDIQEIPTKIAATSGAELIQSEPRDVFPPVSPARFTSTVFEVGDIFDDDDDDATPRASRLGRSLRPRKPIQEHPYLLESAQYSKTLKSHGVRPLRVQIEEAARRRQEEDSQEQDYEEESQSTTQGIVHEDSGESQGIQRLGLLNDTDDEDPLARDPSPPPEPREASSNILPSSSQIDEDEFPDPADIHKWKFGKRSTTATKRQASPKASKKQKIPRLHQPVRFAREASPAVNPDSIFDSIFDIPPSPPQTSPNFLDITPVPAITRSNPITTLTPKPSSTVSSRVQSPAPANRNTNMVDLTMADDETGSEQGAGSSSESEGDAEKLRASMRRRMRGVLPASWLRLDQHGARQKNAKPVPQRSPERSPERTQRKGVAQRRQISPKPSRDAALFLDDSDDDMTLRVDDFNELDNSDGNFPIFEDDAGSVVEDDQIDYMLPGNKRASTDTDGIGRPKKRRKSQQTTFKGQPGQPKRQQRITGLLNRTKSTTSQSSVKRRAKSSVAGGRRAKDLDRIPAASTPPRLSIVDVIEPNAPPFLRIAARAANKRRDQGRSSPSRKHIALGTRKDNIDAAGVLRDWKKGRIQPRISSKPPSKTQTELPQPLRSLSHNSVVQPITTNSKSRPRQSMPQSRFLQSRRMVKQASIDDFVSLETEVPSTRDQEDSAIHLPKRSQIGRTKSYNATSRPAQLEMTGEKVGRHAFDARKRALDALYRKSRRVLPAPASMGLERLVEEQVRVEKPSEDLSSNDRHGSVEPAPIRRRLTSRKKIRPQHLDTTAPQYTHANDPLPREESPPTIIVEVTQNPESAGKLLGLGPFGTHYTQHFEVFPLDIGVFFHESTLLGSGRLARALDEKSQDVLRRPRGRDTFVLDEKTLRWGQWDEQTSSELGIVFDWIADYLYADSPDSVDNSSNNPIQAADFVLNYLQDHVSFQSEESEKHFAGRTLEILQSFAQRLETLPHQSQGGSRAFVDVLGRTLVISLQILCICRNLYQLSETFQLEEVLKKIAKRTARELLETELVEIRSLYYDLQRMSFREKGIRNEHYSMICWVILIRVLEESRIPRSGFWDVVSSVMLKTDINSINDAHTFERTWYDLFTLLPLGEFDSTGVVIPGIRHTTPLEGWVLPQKLLRRVFQLYESNSRQGPSFNDYCRGVVSRCHYLVEQWGWRKSNAIIGTIFDFFAARGLSHLRNEEVYKSPDFLEHLAESPSLSITPEDKCFHIFLKLLTLSIQRLEKYGLTKDTRNLVARVLPNHNRQYDKEKDIHESDLAALRNHYDLLCALFWVAPANLRPSVQTIEKLIVPGSSHKEACLMSLRAWSQLSRFVISSDEDNATYKPFADWQKNIFQQAMEQYISAESDIQQQLSAMSKDASRSISRDMVNAVVKLNRKSAMDVIHFSMKGFLSVIRLAPTLSAVSFALNHYQLDQVFTRFPFSSADFDWSSLRAALDIADHYVTRIENFLKQGPANADHSWHGEDAIMLLERKMAIPFFSMTRGVIGVEFKDSALGPTSDRSICMEQAILLAGRQAARLIHARLLRVSQFFVTGRYNIFQDMLKGVTSPSRKYRALFFAMLIEQGVDDFKDLYGTILELFLIEIVKPLSFVAYENRLALAIKRHGNPYLRDAVVEIGNSPDYNSNRDLFSHTVSVMRKTLRFSELSQKQQLQSEFSKALKSVMDQMKLDLKSVTLDSREHADHIEFVRSTVTMIRSQDICPVDSYFYQISREYSPSSQDPRLQIAGILSWGLKLEEGDTKAVSGLFYLLFPNFKLALANGKLAEERAIIQQGMKNPHVFSFMLSRMFPAIIHAALRSPKGWILLDTYVDAFDAWLSTPAIHRVIGKEDVAGTLMLLESVLAGIDHLQNLDIADLQSEHVYILIQITRLLNLLSPSFTAYLFKDPNSQLAIDITEGIDSFTDFTRQAGGYLSTLLKRPGRKASSDLGDTITIDPIRLFGGLQRLGMTLSENNEHVDRFSNHIIRDINDNWVSDASSISVRGPSRAQGQHSTQSGQGTPLPKWSERKLVENLNAQLREWNYTNDLKETKMTSKSGGLSLYEFLL
ncbi:Mus7/MMS22 family-domain-containing protein [Hypoxylon trugodes]|uniref:Mus7/MMS22 family-domain-containing protein n=1 Tax=Hypoxylon trugodes TaxID=326681 RepID=UPI002197E1FA|nr:Mus7/MMS22 family-domain-containing protein [Hypoxylon trugodes]KAI1388503.1 Mus7/MMS22 family-domain-containing protein [Hypoxylon trugodes]